MLVDDEDEEVSGILDSDSLDPASLGGGHGGHRSPRALSPARITRLPRPSSPARAASPARHGKRLRVWYRGDMCSVDGLSNVHDI